MGEAVLGEDTTPAQARALALNNARRSAIEQATGAIVHGSSVVYNYQLVSDLVASIARGVIVKEEILWDEARVEGKQIIYAAKIRAYVKALENRERGGLRLSKASLHRYGSPPASSAAVFQENDEIQVRAEVNSAVYLHIFNIGQDGRAIKLFPNEYFKAEKIRAGMEFIFPDEKQRNLGLKLRVCTPKSLTRAIETMLVVATKDNVDFLSEKRSDEATITELMREISEIDPASWVESVLGYEVRK
jgi:hypothetical protein